MWKCRLQNNRHCVPVSPPHLDVKPREYFHIMITHLLNSGVSRLFEIMFHLKEIDIIWKTLLGILRTITF